MRGADEQTGSLFSYVSCEARVPSDHPLRVIRAIVAAGKRQTKFRGIQRVGWSFSLTAAAYNLIRLPRLLACVA